MVYYCRCSNILVSDSFQTWEVWLTSVESQFKHAIVGMQKANTDNRASRFVFSLERLVDCRTEQPCLRYVSIRINHANLWTVQFKRSSFVLSVKQITICTQLYTPLNVFYSCTVHVYIHTLINLYSASTVSLMRLRGDWKRGSGKRGTI